MLELGDRQLSLEQGDLGVQRIEFADGGDGRMAGAL
jgi:hypothetical protein